MKIDNFTIVNSDDHFWFECKENIICTSDPYEHYFDYLYKFIIEECIYFILPNDVNTDYENNIIFRFMVNKNILDESFDKKLLENNEEFQCMINNIHKNDSDLIKRTFGESL